MRESRTHSLATARPFAWLWTAAAMVSTLLLTAAARGDDIVRVEEDWELVIAQPVPANLAPQITTIMSPYGYVGQIRARFTLNAGGRPVAKAGGLRLQIWFNNLPVVTRASHVGTLLAHANETITWTQVMGIGRHGITFAVIDGKSQTWGDFGQRATLALHVNTRLVNLNQYNYGVSAVNSGVSGITMSPTRVRSLTILAVREYSDGGLVAHDITPTLVFAY